MPWSSNGTYLVEICKDGDTMRAVYKPGRGERPLWDFPDGLYRRAKVSQVIEETTGQRVLNPDGSPFKLDVSGFGLRLAMQIGFFGKPVK